METVHGQRRVQERVVGIGELFVSRDPRDLLVTHSLGSCIGLTLYDPVAGVGGMLHAMLPLSSADPRRSARDPAMYTDSGVTALLQGLFDMGARRRSLVACAAGAANNTDTEDLFRIGERNQMVLRKLLWKNDILLTGEDVGGTASRTLFLDMSTGDTLLRSGGVTTVLSANGGRWEK